ncbi:MAG: hypothetical protein ACREN4_07100 [Candidatus Dormibacteria bacterium]
MSWDPAAWRSSSRGKLAGSPPGRGPAAAAQLAFVGSAIFHYLGPALAAPLCAPVAVPGLARLGIVGPGLDLIARRALGREGVRLLALGTAPARMNGHC